MRDAATPSPSGGSPSKASPSFLSLRCSCEQSAPERAAFPASLWPTWTQALNLEGEVGIAFPQNRRSNSLPAEAVTLLGCPNAGVYPKDIRCVAPTHPWTGSDGVSFLRLRGSWRPADV